MKRLAAIDIGTQTIRLLIADCDPSGMMTPVFRDRQIIRLGEGMSIHRFLGKEPLNRAVKCISSFKNTCDRYKAEQIFAAATACVREASNPDHLIRRVLKETGIKPVILSGEDEAGLTLKGVRSVIQSADVSLVLDIGGGSTELILTLEPENLSSESLQLGVVTLTEKFLQHDPPLSEETDQLFGYIHNTLISGSRVLNRLKDLRTIPEIIGTAGSITTLAAMDLKMNEYHPSLINGHILTKNKIKSLLEKITGIPASERKELPGLEKGREIVILTGAAIILCILQITGADKLKVSDSGLLEGILISKLFIH